MLQPTCISSPKSTERPNNKEHTKEDPNGFASKWTNFSWASITLFMGQRRCEDMKRLHD